MQKAFIRVRTEEQAQTLAEILKNEWDGSPGVCVMYPVGSGSEIPALLKEAGACVFADLPFIARENISEDLIKDMNEASWAEGFVIKNVDEMGILKSIAFKGPVIGDSFLYAYNSKAAGFYREHFPDIRFIAPDELTDDELFGLPGSRDIIYKAYGRARVMLTAQSLSGNYGQPESAVTIRSVKNDRFISMDEDYGYTSVYTEKPVSMPDALADGRWENVMADLTSEGRAESAAVFRAMLGKGELPPGTRGHHYKGID